MKKSIQIQIPEPCHENWDKMTTANQGRFCNACSKVVVDFSMMSDKEVLNHISKASSKICGRVSQDQLNRPIQTPVEKKRISFKYLWSLLISSFLVSYKTQAQGKIKLDSIVTNAPQTVKMPEGIYDKVIVVGQMQSGDDEDDNNFPGKMVVKGRVTDENGNPIPLASLKIENSSYGKVADSRGRFKLKIPNSYASANITVSSIGYEAVTINVSDNNIASLDVVLKNAYTELLGEVVVTALPTISCTRTTGAMMIVTTVSYQNRIMDTLRQFIGKSDIKIYPNPVSAGKTFNVSFNVIETGNYRMELYDASGRLMHSSSLPILSKKQVMNFGSGWALIPGIYFVKILNAREKNVVYSGSLLVQ